MSELRLVGVSEDGERLVLTDETGAEYSLVIDERLRAAVHGHLSRLGQLTMALESRISPREIQDRVRSGESAEHVAQTAAVPLDRVLRFIGPVLREREHIADQARRARLAGTTGPTSLLGDLVARAASRRGVDAEGVAWDSARREDHSWIVTTTWPDGTVATWSLDTLRHQATPVDQAARRISGVLDEAPDGSTVATAARGFPDIADSPEFARFDADASDEPDESRTPNVRAEATGGAKVHRFVPRAVPDAVDDAASDRAVGAAETDEIDDAGSTGPDGSVPEVAPAARPATSRSSRRAKVPKWDDIMFGMKPKDGS
jgi:Protein of unknown function (DUF3071)